MRTFLILSTIVYSIFGCAESQSIAGDQNPANDSLLFKKNILRGVAKDSYWSNPSDSCYFRAFVSDHLKIKEMKQMYFTFYDYQIYDATCPYSTLNFSLIRNKETNEFLFHDRRDVYFMMWSKELRPNQIVEVSAKTLNEIADKLIGTTRNSEDKIDKFRTLIALLYSNITVREYNGNEQLKTRFGKESNEAFFSEKGGFFFVADISAVGTLIFEIDLDPKRPMNVEEFVVTDKKEKFFRTDTRPPQCK